VDLGLAGRVAVVTGGASGIGAATARMLRDEGARVALWDRRDPSEAISPATSDAPHAEAAPAIGVQLDVTDGQAVADAWVETTRQLGEIDLLVHAAAIGSGRFGFPYTNLAPDDWRAVLEVNVMGMVQVAHVAGLAMQRRSRGAMVFVSSVAGQIGSQTDPPYSATKAANINFAQCMARDLAPYGVRVNTVCPGMVQTALNRSVWQAWHDRQPEEQRKSYEEWAGEKVRRVVPLGRWQKSEDVAAMIVFLCSDRSSEVTGQTINVDGGFVMH
jgi:2-hydroxycyclohexanecarboxyl-CoA dehydrogenase